MSECSIDGCDRAHNAHGWCLAHYKRWRRWGDPLGSRQLVDAGVRFWAKVDKSGPIPTGRPDIGRCWAWTAGKTRQGYGGFHPVNGQTVLAHRWSFEQAGGQVPGGMVLDHLCRNRACVNPAHLEPVSNLENLRRGAGYALRNGMRDRCINGHRYTRANTYTDPTGGVRCRQCARDRDKRPSRNTSSRRQTHKQRREAQK